MELPTTVESCHALLIKQGQAMDQMLSRIAELEARLSQNSSNSSRPPSSDGLSKKPAFPRSSGRKRGGQLGHRGDTLQMVEQANEVVLHEVRNLCSCGRDLRGESGQISARRQVFDLPPQALVVTEHQSERKVCLGCGQVHQGTFPEAVSAPVQYGNRVKALVSLLSVGHNMPVGGPRGAASRACLPICLDMRSTKLRFKMLMPYTMNN